MELLKKLKTLIKDNKKFYKNYIKSSLLLNVLVISLSAVYEIIPILSFLGQIVGALFLLTYFWNLGLILLNDKCMNLLVKPTRRFQFLTYLYLIIAILSTLTLINTGLGEIKRMSFDPLYYVLFYFAFYLSYLDYKKLKILEKDNPENSIQINKNENILKLILIFFTILIITFIGIYGYNLLTTSSQESLNLIMSYVGLFVFIGLILVLPIFIFLLFKFNWKKPTLTSSLIGLLKITLLSLCLLTFIFAGVFVFNILSFGAPINVIFYLINFIFPAFFAILILLVPVASIIIYKIMPPKSQNITKALTILGLFLTLSLSLPFITTPISVLDANNQFTEAFGKNWNKFEPRVEEEFLDVPYVLIQSWFGEPDLDPDSWKLDANNVYKETDDYKLKFDVYYPGKIAAQFIGKKSTIIFIHGGGWSAREREDGAPYLRYLAAQGYICFTIDYRLLERSGSPDKSFVGDYNIEQMMRDVANFTQYLAANEEEDEIHGADLDNVFIIGQSAGAHLAGVTGFGYNDDEWGLDQRLKIKGIVLFYPPNDAREFFYGNALYDAGISKYKTPSEDPNFFDLYTPSELVDNDDPPCLIFQGTSDTYVPYENAVEIKKACQKAEVDVILVTSYFMGHAHDISVLVKTMALYYMERFFYLIKED
ncbi:MAG: hypothetical protein EU532_01445 [Promethearchaeota archaeon]|nr:MAG: hypothetical protein EU532_01445 [Candidatus Lokiarchaeota archaeon]